MPGLGSAGGRRRPTSRPSAWRLPSTTVEASAGPTAVGSLPRDASLGAIPPTKGLSVQIDVPSRDPLVGAPRRPYGTGSEETQNHTPLSQNAVLDTATVTGPVRSNRSTRRKAGSSGITPEPMSTGSGRALMRNLGRGSGSRRGDERAGWGHPGRAFGRRRCCGTEGTFPIWFSAPLWGEGWHLTWGVWHETRPAVVALAGAVSGGRDSAGSIYAVERDRRLEFRASIGQISPSGDIGRGAQP